MDVSTFLSVAGVSLDICEVFEGEVCAWVVRVGDEGSPGVCHLVCN